MSFDKATAEVLLAMGCCQACGGKFKVIFKNDAGERVVRTYHVMGIVHCGCMIQAAGEHLVSIG